MDDLRISVAEVLGRPGEFRDVEVSARLGEARTELAKVAETPVRGRLRLESVVEGILVTGGVEGDTVLTCARCLTEIPSRVAAEVCELYAHPGVDVPGEEEVYRIRGDEVDLEFMLRDALVLSLPLNPVCDPACAGICAHCGKDLSEGPCDCRDDPMDPRWAGLSALRAKLDG